jgi:hypothetical protein
VIIAFPGDIRRFLEHILRPYETFSRHIRIVARLRTRRQGAEEQSGVTSSFELLSASHPSVNDIYPRTPGTLPLTWVTPSRLTST